MAFRHGGADNHSEEFHPEFLRKPPPPGLFLLQWLFVRGSRRHRTMLLPVTGIAASAPAIYWVPAMFWAEDAHEYHGHSCELDILTALAAQECDADDAVLTMSMGTFLRDGINHGTDLRSDVTGTAISATRYQDGICEKQSCTPSIPVDPTLRWKEPRVQFYSAVAWEEFGGITRDSGAEYDSVVASSNPDLTGLYEASGKILTGVLWHGLAMLPKMTMKASGSLNRTDMTATGLRGPESRTLFWEWAASDSF
ncbi:hypothetical protein F4775DRAFT_597839 [Biscogniauxia sp. FL1348]|nr:hypothetical protein F4775DRAFT_597839 [Biscogniauxia sp. FL1348]